MSAEINGFEVGRGYGVDLAIGFHLSGLRIGAEFSRGMRRTDASRPGRGAFSTQFGPIPADDDRVPARLAHP